MEACEEFCYESVERWVEDLRWAGDDAKLKLFFQDLIHRCNRFSVIQCRLWKRIIELYWRSGWSTTEIAEQFGVGKERVRAIVKWLRREARRFFGQDSQLLQPVRTGQAAQPVLQPEKSKSVHAKSWSTFNEGGTLSTKPRFQRIAKTTSPRKQTGTKTIVIDGKEYPVRVFEAGRPAGCLKFWANPRQKQAGPNREYDPEETKGILAHIPTARDAELAIDGDQDAQEFLAQYCQIHDSKSSPLRDVWSDPPESWQTRSQRPVLLAERQECVRCEKKSMTEWIYPDGAILQRCESKGCAYMAVWKPAKHERIELSDLRTVPFHLSQNLMNNFTQGNAA